MTEKPSTAVLLARTAGVRAAFTAVPVNESTLKDAICDYVDDTKVRGWPVERAIIGIKRISEVEDGPRYRSLDYPIQRDKARDLIGRMIEWCIDHYFRT